MIEIIASQKANHFVKCDCKIYDEFLTYRFYSLNEEAIYCSRESLVERLGGSNIGKDLIVVSEVFADNDDVLCYDVDIWIKSFLV